MKELPTIEQVRSNQQWNLTNDWLYDLFEKYPLNKVDSQAKYPDWSKRDDIKSALKVGLIILLDEHGYPPVERDEVYVEIFEQAENFKKNKLRK